MPSLLPQMIAKEPQIIPAKEETVVTEVIPASEEKVYDKYWMTHLAILSPSPDTRARMVATLVPARDVEIEIDGKITTTKELKPDAEPIPILINDIFDRAINDSDFAAALVTAINSIIKIGQESGIIK